MKKNKATKKKAVRKPRVKKPEDKFAVQITLDRGKPFLASHPRQVKDWEANPKPHVVEAAYEHMKRQGRIGNSYGSPVFEVLGRAGNSKLDIVRDTLKAEAARAILEGK